MSLAEDTADAEMLMNLVGDINMAIGRARSAGAKPADVYVALGWCAGEAAAAAGEPSASPVLVCMGPPAMRGFAQTARRQVQRIEERATVYRGGAARRRRGR